MKLCINRRKMLGLCWTLLQSEYPRFRRFANSSQGRDHAVMSRKLDGLSRLLVPLIPNTLQQRALPSCASQGTPERFALLMQPKSHDGTRAGSQQFSEISTQLHSPDTQTPLLKNGDAEPECKSGGNGNPLRIAIGGLRFSEKP